MMDFDKINYEQIARKALLRVVKEILKEVDASGFGKKQNLLITFSTKHAGVEISEILKTDFDEELTIILEHEFWDLSIDEYGFGVSLEFEHGDESLYIPFSSIINFQDPSENFCLEFSPDFSDIQKKQSIASIDDDGEKKSNIVSIDIFRKGK